MKTFFKLKNSAWVLLALIAFGLSSCKKDHANLVGGTGAPAITSVSTLSKTVTNSTDSVTVTTYDNTGVPTVVKNPAPTQVVAFDSLTATGNKGNYYVIHGSNLGSVTSVQFNGVSAYFNSALVSDNAIFVSIPANVPTVQQPNKITVTTLHGKVNFSFTVLTPPPTISSVSDYDFTAGSQITLTGVSFASVSAVGLVGSTATVTIVSKTDAQLVLQFPAATVNRTSLIFTYASGTVTSPVEFIDLDNAYKIFTDQYYNGFGDASWGDAGVISTTTFKTGTSSVGKTFAKGNWHQFGFGYNNINQTDGYKYLSFWIKGAAIDHDLWISTSASTGGFASFNDYDKITVKAGVWTYFKIPVDQLKLWSTAGTFNQIGFRIQGPDNQDETFYIDDLVFVK